MEITSQKSRVRDEAWDDSGILRITGQNQLSPCVLKLALTIFGHIART